MVKVLKNIDLVNGIGIVIALLIGSVFLAVVSPELGFVTGLLLLLVPGFALIKPLPKLSWAIEVLTLLYCPSWRCQPRSGHLAW